MTFFHTVRQTAAGAIALPQPNLYLVRATIGQAATNVPAAISYLYDGVSNAIFPVDSPAVATSQDGVAIYQLNHQVKGSQIPAAAFTFTGTITYVEWVFSDQPNQNGVALSEHRAILFRRTDGGAVTANITVNFDVGPNAPKAVLAFCTPASRARFLFPATGPFVHQVEAFPAPLFQLGSANGAGPISRQTVPTLAPSPSLTLSGISDGATTIMAVVYY